MPGFAQPSDLFNFVGAIFEKAYHDPYLGEKLSATGAVLLVKCTEPDSEIVLDMPNKKVYSSAADSPVEANAVIKMDSDTANRFWQGKVNMTLAMAKGQVTTEGAIMKVLKLVPSTKFLFPIYIDALNAAGRQDLLV